MKTTKNYFITLFLFLLFSLFIPIFSVDAITDNQTKATVQIICEDSVSGHWYSGSGTIIDSSGIVLTNKHVITGSDGNIINYCLVGTINHLAQEPDFQYIARTKHWTTTSDMDAAILYIDNKNNKNFSWVDIFNSNSDFLSFGNKIEVVGYPSIGGTNLTYTEGVFSGTGSVSSRTQNYIKTTAVLGHGNSGGGAYSNGRFIGIPTAVISDLSAGSSIGYVLSLNSIKKWLKDLLGYNYENYITEHKESNLQGAAVIKNPKNKFSPDVSSVKITQYPVYEDYKQDSQGKWQGINRKMNFNWTMGLVKSENSILGSYVYFGRDMNSDPTKDGIFTKSNSVKFPLVTESGTYYFILRIIDEYGNLSEKLIYKYEYEESFECPKLIEIIKQDTRENFKLHVHNDIDVFGHCNDWCHVFLPGMSRFFFAWDALTNSENIKGYHVAFNQSPVFYLEETIFQENNTYASPLLKHNSNYYLHVAVEYNDGRVLPECLLTSIGTLKAGQDYQQYLLFQDRDQDRNNANLKKKTTGTLVRMENSLGIYLIEEEKKRPIKSAEIFLGRGYKWGDVVEITQEEMNSYPLGKDLTLDEERNNNILSEQENIGTLTNGSLVRAKGTHGVYLIHNNEKRPIKSAEIFLGRGYKWSDVVDVERSMLNVYPLGLDVALGERIDITIENQGFIIKINVPSLRVRSLPGLNGKIITSVSKGEEYPVIEERGGWHKINYIDNKTGWVMSKYTAQMN